MGKTLESPKPFVGFGSPGAVPTTGTAMAELLISKHKTLPTLFEIIQWKGESEREVSISYLDARSARSTALTGASMITGWLEFPG